MIINYNELQDIHKKNKNKTIILALGSFDLFHYEHLQFLKDAKSLCKNSILVVGIKDDLCVKAKGPNRPIIEQDQRLAIINELKCVDYVVLASKDSTVPYQDFGTNEDAKFYWQAFYNIFINLKPDILYHENTQNLQPARDKFAELLNIKLIARPRTARITTSNIIKKIKKLD